MFPAFSESTASQLPGYNEQWRHGQTDPAGYLDNRMGENPCCVETKLRLKPAEWTG